MEQAQQKKYLILVFMLLACNSLQAQYYSGAVKCRDEVYAGSDRAYIKTHRIPGRAHSFDTFKDFYFSDLLIPDEDMAANPDISKDSENPRLPEEEINVDIKLAYIYGIYREDDNDYHMIIGDGSMDTNKMHLFNVEISALAGDEEDPVLVGIRAKIVDYFGDITCNTITYKPKKVTEVIPIRIKGALFFDIDHPVLNGKRKVGWGPYKPFSAWELHPVTYLKFLD